MDNSRQARQERTVSTRVGCAMLHALIFRKQGVSDPLLSGRALFDVIVSLKLGSGKPTVCLCERYTVVALCAADLTYRLAPDASSEREILFRRGNPVAGSSSCPRSCQTTTETRHVPGNMKGGRLRHFFHYGVINRNTIYDAMYGM